MVIATFNFTLEEIQISLKLEHYYAIKVNIRNQRPRLRKTALFLIKNAGNVKQYIRKNTILMNKRIEKFLKFLGI